MRWELQWGDKRILSVLEARQRRGVLVPALESEPEVYDDLFPIWKVFLQLSPGRPHGASGALALSSQTVLDTLRLYEFEGDALREAFELINAMDAELLSTRKKS